MKVPDVNEAPTMKTAPAGSVLMARSSVMGSPSGSEAVTWNEMGVPSATDTSGGVVTTGRGSVLARTEMLTMRKLERAFAAVIVGL